VPIEITKGTFPLAEVVPIVSDAAIATHGVGGGRMIPLLILDTRKRPDFDELVRTHQFIGPGDIEVQWGRPSERKYRHFLLLGIKFTRPVPAQMYVPFDLQGNQIALAESVLRSEAVYLQPGKPGDRLKDDLEAPKILAEIPRNDIVAIWDEIYVDEMAKQLRRMDRNLTRRESKARAKLLLRKWREYTSIRIP
jgi:hypothetical protein